MRSCWSSKLSKILFAFIIVTSQSLAQQPATDPAPPANNSRSTTGYSFPLQPGKRAMLTGTMGELRSTHFHAGLDINTETVGENVHAANDGYIYRATITTGGYGTVLYVRHPDGNGTLYAHLTEFLGPVADFIKLERYKRKTSEIDLFFQPGQFPVTKGSIIAKSGNTGGSGGPHLHFELRSPQEEALNPMTRGYAEVVDKTPPLPQRIAFRTMDVNSRINNQFGRFEYALQRKGKDYVLNQPMLASGAIGIEILAHDKQENSTFRFGINQIEMYANNEKVFSQKIERINYGESRNILALLDFRTMETRGYRFNKLYVDDGNRLPYYSGTTARRGIKVKGEDVAVEIRLTDFHQNTTSVFTTLKSAPLSATTDFSESSYRALTTEINGSVLSINVSMCPAADESRQSSVQVFSHGSIVNQSPSYSARSRNVYLIDLNKALPDSVVTCAGTWVSNFKDRIPSNINYKYYSDLIDIDFPQLALYDTLFLATEYDSTFRETFTIGSRTTPLEKTIRIQLKPLKQYVPRKSLGVYRVDGNGYTHMSSIWKNGRVAFNTLSLGQFTIMNDTIPPGVRPVTLSGSTARMRMRDDLSGISYFEASINGQWLLMTYDYKTGIAYSERLDQTIPLKGDFEMKVVDNAGNETIFKQRIP